MLVGEPDWQRALPAVAASSARQLGLGSERYKGKKFRNIPIKRGAQHYADNFLAAA